MTVLPPVEIVTASPSNATTATLTFTATPQPGDQVWLVVDLANNASAFAVSGLGASWVQKFYDIDTGGASENNATHALWVGTGATASGAVTVSWDSGRYGMLRGFLIRGLNSSDVTVTKARYAQTPTSINPGNVATTSAIGPSDTATAGQFVLDFYRTDETSPSAFSFPATQAPSGWVVSGVVKPFIGGHMNTAYRIPDGSAAHQLTATSTTNRGHWITQAVIGSADGATPAPVTGSVAASVRPASVSLAGTADAGVVTGDVAAAAPAAVVAVAGNSEGAVSGVVSASAPAAMVAVAGDVAHVATRLQPWSADLSRRTRLVLRAVGSIDSMPPLELPPDGFTERPLMRQSLTVPALTSMADVVGGQAVSSPDYAALEDAATVEEVGVPHVIIGGHDVTYFRGVPTQIGSFRSEEPFGDLSASVVFPQITSMDDEPDDSNVHPFNWSRIRANVQFVLRRPDGTKTRLWSGHVVSHDVNGDVLTLSCQGSLWQASTDVHKVPTMLDPTDIGTLITKALNGVASRRYPRLAAPRTGIMSRQRGSWSDSPLAYVQNLLATAWTASGRQWTVAKVPNTWRTYEMRLKKVTPQWTVTNGARGVQADLTRDGVAVRNVVYGHGVGKDGYAWWNYHYPNLRQDDAPAYPYSSSSTVMTVGSTDAGTTSGEGVTVWQARARDLGYNVTVNGVFSSDDASAARAIQHRYGLQVDGVVGPQTWAGTFDVGGNGGDLTGAIRLPLAADPRTQEWLFNADGSVAGENPEYDPNHLIYADDVDFGSGVSREQGIESAQQIVDRESDPGWTGRITLRADPREGSRFLIAAGDKITLVGFRGADRVLHITAAEYDLQGLTVTLDVDEKSRDAMTLAQIRDRNKESRKDPARRPGNVNRRSRLDVDQVVPFDGESGAGWIPKHALYGGLWTVIRVPVSELGRVAKLDVRTSGPASRFAFALFGAPIQPEHLVKYVGNPLTSDSPFEAHAAVLEDRFGFIEGWGQSGQAAGYWPGQDGGTLTGRLVDTGGFEYVSAKPPWVWVAEFSASSTFIQGRILPAPVQ